MPEQPLQSTSTDVTSPTRRQFLTSAAAAGTLTGALSISRSAHAGGGDTITIALIGCGGRGTGACGQALSTAGPVKLIAMADAFADQLDRAHYHLSRSFPDRVAVPEEHRFVGLDAYQKAIDAGPDLVILTTPPGFRPIHFEAAVQAGKHVFMEKPVATDAGGVRRVLAAAEEANRKNLKVGVGLQRHHQASYQQAVQRLHDGAIGDIRAMRIYWNGQTAWVRPREKGKTEAESPLASRAAGPSAPRPRAGAQTEMEYQVRNWYYFVWTCGDFIVEQHIHNIDVANWVLQGHPVKANGMGGREVLKGSDYGEIFDHHCVEFEYANGARVFSQCRHIPGCWNEVSEAAQGTKGTSFTSQQEANLTANGKKIWQFNHREHAKDPYQVEHDDLFAAIRENRPYNEAENGAQNTMTAILGRMCTYSGQVLTWDEALHSQLSVMPKEFSWQATPPTVPDQFGNYPIPVPGKTKVV